MFGRRIAITYEGWHYLGVLIFIVGGAMLQDVNLLVVLAGMMIGAFLTNAACAFTIPRRLEVERKSPDHVFAGEPFTMVLALRNPRRRLAVWMVAISDSLRRLDRPKSVSQTTRVDVFLSRVGSRTTGRASYRCLLPNRGRYAIGPLEVSSGFPFGLLRGRRRLTGAREMLVYPDLGRLTKTWDQHLQTQRAGDDRAGTQRGWQDGDFYGIREWRPGDAQRWIHWRASAKLNELAIRQFERLDSWDSIVLLDLWRPDRYGPPEQEITERAISFFATVVARACERKMGRILAGAAAQEMEVRLAMTSSALKWDWLQWLATAQPMADNDLPMLLSEAQRRAPAAAKMIVISTRSESARPLGPAENDNTDSWSNVTWLDCGGDQWRNYFQWR